MGILERKEICGEGQLPCQVKLQRLLSSKLIIQISHVLVESLSLNIFILSCSIFIRFSSI